MQPTKLEVAADVAEAMFNAALEKRVAAEQAKAVAAAAEKAANKAEAAALDAEAAADEARRYVICLAIEETDEADETNTLPF